VAETVKTRSREFAPHPHFVSPSPRKKTLGEGLSVVHPRYARGRSKILAHRFP